MNLFKSKENIWGGVLALIIYVSMGFLLERLFPVDTRFIPPLEPYTRIYSRRALVGLVVFAIVALFASLLRDLKRKQVAVQVISNATRIAMALYLFEFWFNFTQTSWHQDFNLPAFYSNFFTFYPLFFLINAFCALYLIFFEPWKAVAEFINPLWKNPFYPIANCTIVRILAYLLLNLLFYLFSKAGFPDNATLMILSTFLFILTTVIIFALNYSPGERLKMISSSHKWLKG